MSTTDASHASPCRNSIYETLSLSDVRLVSTSLMSDRVWVGSFGLVCEYTSLTIPMVLSASDMEGVFYARQIEPQKYQDLVLYFRGLIHWTF